MNCQPEQAQERDTWKITSSVIEIGKFYYFCLSSLTPAGHICDDSIVDDDHTKLLAWASVFCYVQHLL